MAGQRHEGSADYGANDRGVTSTDHERVGIDPDELRDFAIEAMADAPTEPGLDEKQRELIGFGVAMATTNLDLGAGRGHATAALELGATTSELTEVMFLVAPLGMHTLHEGVRELADVVGSGPDTPWGRELTPEEQELRARFEGGSGYWRRLDAQLPGFLDGLLRLSPIGYQRFFEMCAIAWETGSLPPLTKELIYLAIDATPTHRYGPGFRLHLENARLLGATSRQVDEVLSIATAASGHRGVR